MAFYLPELKMPAKDARLPLIWAVPLHTRRLSAKLIGGFAAAYPTLGRARLIVDCRRGKCDTTDLNLIQIWLSRPRMVFE
jgi:hypothetical protein